MSDGVRLDPAVTGAGAADLTGAGQELMNIWNEMDRGSLKEDEAFQEADRAVRRKQAPASGEV